MRTDRSTRRVDGAPERDGIAVARQRSVRAIDRRWRPERWTGRLGGRRYRAARRSLAVLLVVLAGVSATRDGSAVPGVDAVALTRDLEVGAALTVADIELTRIAAPPDGALRDPASAEGRRLTSAARRGEILTDRRLVDTPGPEPGPGRAAVAVRPSDPALLQLLQAGTPVAVVSVGSDGQVRPLTADALVLAVLDPDGGSGTTARPVLLSVPAGDADRLAGATLSGDVALRLR